MLTGRVAQFGRGIAQDVAKKMLDEFAVCLEQEISGANVAAAAEPASENVAADAATSEYYPPAAATGGTARDTAGATVEGAIVAGPSPTEAAAAAPTTPTQQPAIQKIPSRDLWREPEPLDLGATVRDGIPKRLYSVLAGLGVLFVLLWLFGRRR